MRAVRAADNSPWWTKRSALAARAAGPGSPGLLWVAGEGAASCNSRTQSPARNRAARRSNSSGGRVAPGVPWCSSIRGANRNNFQPRHCSAPEEGWVMPARASRSACWKVGWSRRGTDWKRKARWRKTGRRSMPSSAVQPEGSGGGGIGGGGGGGGVGSGRALGLRLAGGRGEEVRTRPPRGPRRAGAREEVLGAGAGAGDGKGSAWAGGRGRNVLEAWSKDTARDNPAYSWRHTSWAGALKYPSGCISRWRTHGRWTCAPGGKPAAAAANAALAMAASWWGDRSRAFRIAGTGTGPAVWSAMRARSHQSSHKGCCCHARSAAGVRAPVPACSKGT